MRDFDVPVEGILDLELEPPAFVQVEVRVQDADSGSPLPMELQSESLGGGEEDQCAVRSIIDGQAKIQAPQAGRYLIQVQAPPGFAEPDPFEISLGTEEVLEKIVRLRRL